MAKLRVGLLFGGRSVEHEVSIASATSILEALDPNRYDVSLIAIDHDGRWHLGGSALLPEEAVSGEEVTLPAAPGERTLVSPGRNPLSHSGDIDVVFPIVHGRGGEDGALQGLLELAELPYVGAGVLGSAMQMDKEVTKRLLHGAGIPVVPWVLVHARELTGEGEPVAERVLEQLDLPLFVKPANLGSSVGISRVDARDDLVPAVRHAARYDRKVLVERAVDAREVEVALLGNHPIEASVPGEIRTSHSFYDYEAKYVDEATELLIPAPMTDEQAAEVRELAVRAVTALEGEGLGRVDFLMERDTDRFFVNEVNSLPGFTQGSMFPKLWEATGLPYSALLDRLIDLALERHRVRSGLETVYRTQR